VSAIDMMPAARAAAISTPFLIMGAIVGALLMITAVIQARCTVYTITNKRVAMRIGAALTVTLNIPFSQLENAALGLTKRGQGNIALMTKGDTRFSFLVLWPHARPWQFARTQPCLRAIDDAQQVADILASAAQSSITKQTVKTQAAQPDFAHSHPQAS